MTDEKTRKCATCDNYVSGTFTKCYACYTKEKQGVTNPLPSLPPEKEKESTFKARGLIPSVKFTTGKKDANAWHDDPLIDILTKMNFNLGKIRQALETMPRGQQGEEIPDGWKEA
jgi:hypothetical protein